MKNKGNKNNSGVVVSHSYAQLPITELNYDKTKNMFYQNITHWVWKTVPESIDVINFDTGNSCQFVYSHYKQSQWFFESLVRDTFDGQLVLKNDR